jgi:hypothetical protein
LDHLENRLRHLSDTISWFHPSCFILHIKSNIYFSSF